MKYVILAFVLFAVVFTGCNRDKHSAVQPETKITDSSRRTQKNKSTAASANNTTSSLTNAPPASESFPAAEFAPGITDSTDVLYTGEILFPDNSPAGETEIEILGAPKTHFEQNLPLYAKLKSNTKGQFRIGLQDDYQYQITAVPANGTKVFELLKTADITPSSSTPPYKKQYHRQLITHKSINQQFIILSDNGSSQTQAEIFILSDNNVTTATLGKNGIYTAEHIKQGEAYVLAKSAGFAPAFLNKVNLPSTGPIEIKLAPGGATIKGKASDVSDSPVTSGTLITIGFSNFLSSDIPSHLFLLAYRTRTVGDGNYKISSLPAGTFNLHVASQSTKYGSYPQACSKEFKMTVADNEVKQLDISAYTGFTVSGYITDKESSSPLAGIKVTTIPYSSETITDSKGRYQLNNIFESTRVYPVSDKYLPVKVFAPPILKTCDQTEFNLDIPMVEAVKVSGKVTNAEGLPVPNASIETPNRDSMESSFNVKGYTNNKGEYSLLLPPLSSVTLEANAAGYAKTFSPLLDTGITPTKNFDIVLKRGVTVTGKVTDPKGNPLFGVNIKVNNDPKIISTNSSGAFRVENMLTDRYNTNSMNFSLPGYIGEYKDLGYSPQKDGETSDGLHVIMSPASKLSGKIIYRSRQPVSSNEILYVAAKPDKGTTSTIYLTVEGVFISDSLPESTTFTLSIPKKPAFKPIDVKANSTNIVLVLDEEPTTKSETTTSNTAYITVKSKATGKPIPDAKIEIEISPTTIITKSKESSGVLIVKDYLISLTGKVTAKDYLDGFVKLPFSDSQKVHFLSTELSSGGTLTGKIVDKKTQQPLADRLIRIYGSLDSANSKKDKPRVYTTSDKEGKFTLPLCKSGHAVLSVKEDKPYAEFIQQVIIKDDEVTDLGTIEIVHGATIHGQILKADKTPYGPAMLMMLQTSTLNDDNAPIIADDNGKFTKENIPPGDYAFVMMNPQVFQTTNVSEGEIKELLIQLGGTKFIAEIHAESKPIIGQGILKSKTSSEVYLSSTNGEKLEFQNIVPGKYKLDLFRQNPDIIQTFNVEIPDQAEYTESFTITLGGIEGIVTDTSGKPVRNVTVLANPRPGKSTSNTDHSGEQYGSEKSVTKCTTGKEGEFDFQAMEAGNYDVIANYDNAYAIKRGIVVGKEKVKIKLVLESKGGSLESLCIDAETGLPITNATCNLKTLNGVKLPHSVSRNENGEIKIFNIPPGDYFAEIEAENYATAYHRVEIKSDETVKLEDALYPGGNLEWTIFDETGFPMYQGVSVIITPLQTELPASPRSALIEFGSGNKISGLLPGLYKGTFTANEKNIEEQFTIISGETTTIITHVK